MIYNNSNHLSHQQPTMSSTSKTSPRARHKDIKKDLSATGTGSTGKASSRSGKTCATRRSTTGNTGTTSSQDTSGNKCRGRCRVQWSEKHVKEGLVLVQEAQLARVVKTRPISEHYDLDPKPFASGQWARVYKCRSRSTGTVYAAKFSSRNRFNADCSAELRHEIALLSLCSQSPRVVRLHDVYETPKEIIMVMEYAPGGDLQTLIDGDLVPLEGDVVHFVRQLVEGLAYLHERNIAHLDIKPQNLVMMGSFPDCNVKLCDFEISRVVLEGTEVREILGTPDYVAPEILHYEPITLAADMWSLGVTTYVLLSGFSPFGGETDQETFKNIILGQVDFPEELFGDVSGPARDFVAKLLVLEPSARMTAKQCLRHEWLREAPTQASAHLRKYLSKSREVLLERVVSRENLRRAALLSQTAQQQQQQQQKQEASQQWSGLSQSEMYLNRDLTSSQGSLSLSGCDDYENNCSSRTSLADSFTSSRSSLAMSQSCLLNKEQTQGLLNQAQDRRSLRASMAQGLNRVSVLSKIRGLNQVQSRSQACLPLLNGLNYDEGRLQRQSSQGISYGGPLDSCFFDGSREKLYGLKTLSKSQGMLDIYRSLESLQRHKRDSHQKERSKTEDVLPCFRQLGHGSSSGSLVSATSSCDTTTNSVKDDSEDRPTTPTPSDDQKISSSPEVQEEICKKQKVTKPETANTQATESKAHMRKTEEESQGRKRQQQKHPQQEEQQQEEQQPSIDYEAVNEGSDQSSNNAEERKNAGPASLTVSETNLDSLQSLESDTLTDDSEERNSLTNNKQSPTGSECHGRETDSDNDEPKFTVAQLVSAFNKHQEVAQRSSLESIMSEKRIADDSTNFPIGPKALRLFIPDIDISERKPLVRRKTSYKPRKNWEELRKQNEKNEGVLKDKDFYNDSGNEEDADPELDETPTKSEETTIIDHDRSPKITDHQSKTPPSPVQEQKNLDPVGVLNDATEQKTETPTTQENNTRTSPKIIVSDDDSTNNSINSNDSVSRKSSVIEQPIIERPRVRKIATANIFIGDVTDGAGIQGILRKNSTTDKPKEKVTKSSDSESTTASTPNTENNNASRKNSSVDRPPQIVETPKPKITTAKITVSDNGLNNRSRSKSTTSVTNNNNYNNVANNNNNSSNTLASKISVFAERRTSKSPTRPDAKSRIIAKDKLCTGSYTRAMEKFSGKANVEKQQPRSRKSSAVSQPGLDS